MASSKLKEPKKKEFTSRKDNSPFIFKSMPLIQDEISSPPRKLGKLKKMSEV